MKRRVKIVFDRKKTSAKTGEGKIELCVYLNQYQRKWVTVGTATPNNWMVIAESLSVVSKVKHYEQIIKAMEMLQEEMTIENFDKHTVVEAAAKQPDSHLFNGNDQRQSFIEFIEDYLEKEGLRSGSRRNIVVVIDALKDFGQIKSFNDLTPLKIRAFDSWLHSQGDKSLATIYNYHKKVHKYTKILWKSEMIPSDPYNHVSFKRGSYKEREPLTEDELMKLRKSNFSDKLNRVRDLFIFMAYTGLAYVDMCKFNFQNDAQKQGNTYYIDSARVKTGTKFYTPILPPAMEVLERYDYKLPIISNQRLNDYLGVIKEKLDFKKKITCHVARHSFATLLLSHDVPMEKAKKTLGHKDIRTTQLYAKVLNKSIVDCTEKLIESIL